ncbi:Response regulator receiver domain-containing protein [Halostagnicola kamekurae]|uniref:Response regulator receiver domain-containing protein n=2 Tax=Halostagnicola kamekurae TaxID=619731 RepID=A0A1I6S3W8_9EURY|nr:Response regulator receiver domain-containing protein [Halostagnicola kamekurae]
MRQGTADDSNGDVLVVDDDPRLADLFAAWLEPNWTVQTAYDGEQALETVDDSTEVVLLDRRMSGLSGDEVLSLLRASGYDCYVIIVSAIDPSTERLEADWDDYLVKPISKATLLEKIERVTAQRACRTTDREGNPVDSPVN